MPLLNFNKLKANVKEVKMRGLQIGHKWRLQNNNQVNLRKVRESKKQNIQDLMKFFQLISFYLAEENMKRAMRIIPSVLQIEDDPKPYKEAMSSRNIVF